MTNSLKFTPRSANVALRGNTDRVCQHAANGKSRVGLSRREILSQVKMQHIREELFASFRAKGQTASGQRVALVTNKGREGFHVVGLGLLGLTRRELNLRVKMAGFTAIRFRGLPAASSI